MYRGSYFQDLAVTVGIWRAGRDGSGDEVDLPCKLHLNYRTFLNAPESPGNSDLFSEVGVFQLVTQEQASLDPLSSVLRERGKKEIPRWRNSLIIKVRATQG